MKLKKKQKSKYEIILEYFTPLEQAVSFLYLFLMLTVFPLYVKNQYDGIGDTKYLFFLKSTIAYLAVSVFLYLIKKLLEIKTGKKIFQKDLENISTLDLCVLSYGVLVVLSYLLSDYKEYALKGAAGWEMGLISQMLFVGIYFFLSRQKLIQLPILIVHLIGSVLTFLLGILHRFQIDPLGMYEGLNLDQMIEFLSTIGQATWYSSYICTVFPLGLLLMYVVKEKYWKVPIIIYNGIGFGIIVTQNSDSAFVALAGILILLVLYSCKEKEQWLNFWQIMILMWGTFVGIGALQKLFWQRAIPLNELSLFFSQGLISKIMLILSIGIYLTAKKLSQKQSEKFIKLSMIIVRIGILVILLLIPAILLFIYWNTKGQLQQWFGFQSSNNYLFFDGHWGNNRGSSWMIAWQEYIRLPSYQKLFGVGPDAFSQYLYSVPEVQQRLQELWGNLRLTNAHNEYLNSLFCYGSFGLITWVSVLVGGITIFYKKAQKNPIMLGLALCVMGYACHNIFCYQQVCCTPFLFMALGVGESLTKQGKSHTIKNND